MFRIKLRNYMLKPVLIFGNIWTFALQNLPSIYQLCSNFVKQLFRIQIQKGGKVLLWNQVKSRMETCYSELILVCNLKKGGKVLHWNQVKSRMEAWYSKLVLPKKG